MTTSEGRYTLAELEAMPTLATGQTDDLKVETEDERVWLARTTKADGERWDHRVTHEQLRSDGSWVDYKSYPAL